MVNSLTKHWINQTKSLYVLDPILKRTGRGMGLIISHAADIAEYIFF